MTVMSASIERSGSGDEMRTIRPCEQFMPKKSNEPA